jgi:hypothetical protein
MHAACCIDDRVLDNEAESGRSEGNPNPVARGRTCLADRRPIAVILPTYSGAVL